MGCLGIILFVIAAGMGILMGQWALAMVLAIIAGVSLFVKVWNMKVGTVIILCVIFAVVCSYFKI